MHTHAYNGSLGNIGMLKSIRVEGILRNDAECAESTSTGKPLYTEILIGHNYVHTMHTYISEPILTPTHTHMLTFTHAQ